MGFFSFYFIFFFLFFYYGEVLLESNYAPYCCGIMEQSNDAPFIVWRVETEI